MSFVNPSNILGNILALGVIFWIFFLVYSRIDKTKMKETWEKLDNMFGGKDGR